jgi:hypothetical protein
MKRFSTKAKETETEIASMTDLPENALVWAGLLREG